MPFCLSYSMEYNLHLRFPFNNPLPDENFLDWSKLKEIADDILKCIESEK